MRFQGADHGAYHLNPVLADTDKNDLTFVRALPLAHAADPAAEILIAYEMNGKPLGSDHGSPFRIIVPHWYAVASVKWLKRIDVLTERVRRRVPDRALHVRVGRPAARARRHHARARAHHRPGRRIDAEPGHVHGARQGLVGNRARDASRGQPHRRRRVARGATRPAVRPYHWQDWSFDWDATDIGRHTLRARATDAAGNVQPEVPPWNRLGYGNNAIEVIYVDVV